MMIVVLAMVGIVGSVPAYGATLQWHIVNADLPHLTPGGTASAQAADRSIITLFSASGTFDTVNPQQVTGGGSYEIRDPQGNVTAVGSFDVTGLVEWVVAPGSFPSALIDDVGASEDARAGLAVLKVFYSGGDDGTVVVSCSLDGTPSSVFEGITATKGFVDYVNPILGATLFHVVR
jgi:hypothetical protein